MNKFSISKDHLKNLLSVTTKEHLRVGSAVDCIHIDGDRIYATDGYRLLSYKIYPIEPLQQRQYTIPSDEIKALLVKRGKGVIEVDLSLLSDTGSRLFTHSRFVPDLASVNIDKDSVNLIQTTIDYALGEYVVFKTYGDVDDLGEPCKGLITSSGYLNNWCVGKRYSTQLPEFIPLIEIALDVSKLDLLLECLEWNQLHVTNYAAPVVFSDKRGGAYAEMIFLVMPAEIRNRQYLDVALANAI
jgi:hypothetical protein